MLNAQCPADVMGGYEVAMRFCHLVVNGRRQSTIQSHIASTGYSLLTTRIPILYTVYVSQIWTPGKPLAQATVWSYSYGCVRLNWAKSMKMGGGEVEYDIRVFSDRACKEQVFQATTKETLLVYEVKKTNWMYFVEVRAMDDHRQNNPNTWYPAARSNFVLVPEGQYGWYGVL